MVRNPASAIPRQKLFAEEPHSALNALAVAQSIAFAPYVFHTSLLLRDWGILSRIGATHQEGLDMDELFLAYPERSTYALRVLLEGGLGIGLLLRNEFGKYRLSKAGHFFNNDRMTIVNTNFMRDVCLPGVGDLEASLEQGKPAGLRHLGDWPTIYDGLSKLPANVQKSWFEFDHFYSDIAFPEALEYIFGTDGGPKRLLDIGSNTGKWALACLKQNEKVHLGLVDLPGQLEMALKTMETAGVADRVSRYPQNILSEENLLPKGYDAIWMSQFLDCFSDAEIIHILRKCHESLDEDGIVYINETFWDLQRFPASAFTLQMTSLYFTTMANGNSQMYESKVFMDLVHQAGFRVEEQRDHIGMGHTFLKLKKA